jgi:tetratricopeptide (TPR) repeat protein
MRRAKKYGIFICFFLLVLSYSCNNSNEQDASSYIKKAREFIAQRKYEEASIEYRNALRIDPDNAEALMELADTYVFLRQLNQAARYYQLAAKTEPSSIKPILRLAQIYLQSGRLMEARENVLKALDISPAAIEAYHILSGIQLKERDVESAIETLNKAASMGVNNIKTYISLAMLYIENKDLEKAEAAYLKAIKLDSASRDAYIGLARLYAAQNKWSSAENLLKNMLKTDGIKTLKYTDLARFYESRNQHDLAEYNYQQAIVKSPEQVYPLVNLAEFYARRQMKVKAVVTMQNALEKQKNNPLLYNGLSEIYLHFKEIENANKNVNKALELAPNETKIVFQKGRVLMAQNNYKDALDKFEQVISADRLNAQAYYYRAICIKKRGATDRPEQKIFRAAAGMLDNPEEFEKDQIKGNLLAAIAIDPGMVDARIRLSEIYLLEKNQKKAKEQIEEIFKLTAPNLKVMTLLSGLFVLEGNAKEAENVLQTIVSKAPEYIPAYVRLGMLYTSIGEKDKALDILKTAYEKKPDQLGLINLISDIYLKNKEYDQALAFLNQTMDAVSQDKKAFFENLIGETYLKKNDKSSAVEHFKQALELQPQFIRPRMHMARFYHGLGEIDKAIWEYKIVEKTNAQYVPALKALGFIYDQQGNEIKAEEYYRNILKIVPNDIEIMNNLAFLLSEKTDHLEEAFRLAKTVREKRPKDPNILDTMGWIYYQKGNYLNALSELEESLEINPDSALTNYHYAMALYQNKEYEKARNYFTRALELDPRFQGAEKARQMLN